MGKSLDELVQGYRQFRCGESEQGIHPVQKLARDGQQPNVMIIACADSRVDPAVVLNCDPGDLFVVRNVANIVPPFGSPAQHSVGSALEYAVCYLKV